jgi:FkbM family methyltransferase
VKVKLMDFRYGSVTLNYPYDYYQFLKEIFVYDVYRSYLLKDGDIVLDLGANIGAFTILASRKIGKKGLVIAVEPNRDDYDLLRKNVEINGCDNVTALNIGVSTERETKDITFWGRKFSCNMKPLTEILKDIHIGGTINFIKMDIEGYETSAIKTGMDVFRDADIVSIECHGPNNKLVVDEMLRPLGFTFHSVTTSYLIKCLSRNLIAHPLISIRTVIDTLKNNPGIIYKIFRPDYFGTSYSDVIGSYTRFNLS